MINPVKYFIKSPSIERKGGKETSADSSKVGSVSRQVFIGAHRPEASLELFNAEPYDKKQIREDKTLAKTETVSSRALKPRDKKLEQQFLQANQSFQNRWKELTENPNDKKIADNIAFTEKMIEKSADQPELQALYSSQKAQLEKLLKSH